jgi:hypothetical protein
MNYFKVAIAVFFDLRENEPLQAQRTLRKRRERF